MTLFPLYLAICAVPAAGGLLFKPGAWYRDLDKPGWTPPDKLFPVIWAVLYVLMSWAAARVAMQPGSSFALGLWSLQIAISTLWSAVFFGLRRPDWGLVEVAFLWLSIVVNIALFALVDWRAAALLLPYLAWVTLAARLNQSIVRLNPRERESAAA